NVVHTHRPTRHHRQPHALEGLHQRAGRNGSPAGSRLPNRPFTRVGAQRIAAERSSERGRGHARLAKTVDMANRCTGTWFTHLSPVTAGRATLGITAADRYAAGAAERSTRRAAHPRLSGAQRLSERGTPCQPGSPGCDTRSRRLCPLAAAGRPGRTRAVAAVRGRRARWVGSDEWAAPARTPRAAVRGCTRRARHRTPAARVPGSQVAVPAATRPSTCGGIARPCPVSADGR